MAEQPAGATAGEPALQTSLVAAVGIAVLPAPGFGAASWAAIALSAIAVRTDPECRLASLAATNSRPENHFSMNRHPPTQAGFDKGNGSCQGKTSFEGDLPMKVAQPEPRCFERRGSPPSKSPYTFSLECLMLMIGQMIAPSARMMLPGSYDRQKLKKLRFSMTDNIVSEGDQELRALMFGPPPEHELAEKRRWAEEDGKGVVGCGDAVSAESREARVEGREPEPPSPGFGAPRQPSPNIGEPRPLSEEEIRQAAKDADIAHRQACRIAACARNGGDFAKSTAVQDRLNRELERAAWRPTTNSARPMARWR